MCPVLFDVNIEQQVERPQLDIRPKRDMLVYYGVTIGELPISSMWRLPAKRCRRSMKMDFLMT